MLSFQIYPNLAQRHQLCSHVYDSSKQATLMLAEVWEWRREFRLGKSSLSFQLWCPAPLELFFSKPHWLARIWGQGGYNIISAKHSSDSALNTCIFDLGYGLIRFMSCFLSLNPQRNLGSIAKHWLCKGELLSQTDASLSKSLGHCPENHGVMKSALGSERPGVDSCSYT